MLLFNSKALLSQWKLRNAAVNFDRYRNLLRHQLNSSTQLKFIENGSRVAKRIQNTVHKTNQMIYRASRCTPRDSTTSCLDFIGGQPFHVALNLTPWQTELVKSYVKLLRYTISVCNSHRGRLSLLPSVGRQKWAGLSAFGLSNDNKRRWWIRFTGCL